MAVDPKDLVATLEGPLRTIAEASQRGAVPDVPGFYAWWIEAGRLGPKDGRPHPLEPGFMSFYVGIAQRLRRRVVGNHIRGNTAASTFRFALAALLREERGYQPRVRVDARGRRKYVLGPDENNDLSEWQAQHLRVTWAPCGDPRQLEHEVIQRLEPPLNSEHNSAHAFFGCLNRARRDFRAAAEPL
jgi:hypothetical protein